MWGVFLAGGILPSSINQPHPSVLILHSWLEGGHVTGLILQSSHWHPVQSFHPEKSHYKTKPMRMVNSFPVIGGTLSLLFQSMTDHPTHREWEGSAASEGRLKAGPLYFGHFLIILSTSSSLYAFIYAHESFVRSSQIQKLCITYWLLTFWFKTKRNPFLFTILCQAMDFKSYIFHVHSDLVLTDSRFQWQGCIKAFAVGLSGFSHQVSGVTLSESWTLFCQIHRLAFQAAGR